MVKLYWKNIIIDITDYVDPLSININLSVDGALNYGTMTIPLINKVIDGLDFSRAIPKYTRVMVDDFYFRIGESSVTREGEFWRHEINLISSKKLLERKTLPNMTLTQPKGNIGQFVRSGLNLGGTWKSIADQVGSAYKQSGFEFSTTEKELTYTNPTPSSDDEVIDVKTLKQEGVTYQIKFYMELYRTMIWALDNPLYERPEVEVTVKAGSNTIYYEKFKPPTPSPVKFLGIIPTSKVHPGQKVINQTIQYTATEDDEEIKVYVKGFGLYADDFGNWPMFYYIVDHQISIFTQIDSDAGELKYLDYWVQKLIDKSTGNYILSEESKVRLGEFLSPEWTLNEYDLKTALDEVADSVGAVVTIRSISIDFYGDFVDVIDFDFYDDLERQSPIIEMPNVIGISKDGDLDNYVSELELNAKNLISNTSRPVPYIGGYQSLRALNPNTQIDTTNICVKAPLGIYQITKFVVRGLSISTSERTITEHDITRRVVEFTRWQALPKITDYTVAGRLFVNANQNNMLYFIEGENTIFNMGGTGTLPPEFSGANWANRAIFEACAAEVSEKYDEVVTTKDSGLSINDDIEIYFEYKSYGETRASVFKEDLSGFVERVTKYFNETARLNDPKALGNSAQSIINRLGNTQITYVGNVTDVEDLGNLGGLNTNGEKQLIINLKKELDGYSYMATYVKDFNVINKHIGIKSSIRQWEIPKTELVTHNLKTNFVIEVGTDEVDPNLLFAYHFYILRNQNKVQPTFAHLRFYGPGAHDVSVGASINEIIMGNTITWNIKMRDNYSAGSRKVKQFIGGVPTAWDEEIRYTDVYGNADLVDIEFYWNFQYAPSKATRDAYPEINPANITGEYYASRTLDLDKDAREIFSYTFQTIYSGVGDVTIYNIGMEEYETALAVFDYIPSKQAKKVDLGRVETIPNDTIIYSNLIGVTTNRPSVGYGWYDVNTLDLIMFKKGNIGGYQTIRFRGKDII